MTREVASLLLPVRLQRWLQLFCALLMLFDAILPLNVLMPRYAPPALAETSPLVPDAADDEEQETKAEPGGAAVKFARRALHRPLNPMACGGASPLPNSRPASRTSPCAHRPNLAVGLRVPLLC